MAQNYWKTGGSSTGKKEVRWPSVGQALMQIVVAGLIVGVWGALLWAYLQVTVSAGPATAEAAAPAVAAVEATATSTPTATPPPTATPTVTSSPTASPTATAGPAEAVTAEPAATSTPPPTATPLPEPTATDTPSPEPPPTDTPEPPPADPPAAPGSEVSFAQDVLPIFENRCFKCHGGEKTEEGLSLTDYQDVLAGSWNGKVIVPGSVPDSFLIEQIVSGEMPKKGPRLLPSEIKIITTWVEAGAPNN